MLLTIDARRLASNPILTPADDDRLGGNVNGPSLIRAPDWLDNIAELLE